MDDLREKVIKGLSICGGDDPDCQNCPYYGEYGDGFGCETIMQRDALSLLKAQEPVEPKQKEFLIGYHNKGKYVKSCCGVCGNAIEINYKYCPECGRKVKWDG